jgi:hypothetical protein
MIIHYLWIVNTNAPYTIRYFKQMKKTNTHVSFLLDQTKLRPIDIQDNVTIPIPIVDVHSDLKNFIRNMIFDRPTGEYDH